MCVGQLVKPLLIVLVNPLRLLVMSNFCRVNIQVLLAKA